MKRGGFVFYLEDVGYLDWFDIDIGKVSYRQTGGGGGRPVSDGGFRIDGLINLSRCGQPAFSS